MLAAQEATRYFIKQFSRLTGAIIGLGSVALYLFASPEFAKACYFGMAFPIITSFISFLVTEWAFEQPSMIFFTVAISSLVIRMFNLALAFVVGFVILKMNVGGVIIGLLGTYFSYLVIEIAYIHNKGKLLGQ
jgi:hypothetical protein